MVLFTYKKDQ